MINILPEIYIIDHHFEELVRLKNIIEGNYIIRSFSDSDKAFDSAIENPPDLIIMNLDVSERNGFDFCFYKNHEKLRDVIFLIIINSNKTSIDVRFLDLGAIDFIRKPFLPKIINARIKTHVHLHQTLKAQESINDFWEKEVLSGKKELILGLSRAAGFKDNETGSHVQRMSQICKILSLAVGFSSDEAEIVRLSSTMHDIGKIGIPDRILLKKGQLTDSEWLIMQSHCDIGGRILGNSNSELLSISRCIAVTHHEKWDGSGYPNGLSGEGIPIYGRIAAIADVFDALTNDRSYKLAWSEEKTVEYIRSEKGKQFDPILVEAFLDNHDKIRRIRKIESRETLFMPVT